MRHDPATGALVVMLRGLKMPGMAQAENGGAIFGHASGGIVLLRAA